MILLVTSSHRRVECGKALEQAIGEAVEVCETVRKAAVHAAQQRVLRGGAGRSDGGGRGRRPGVAAQQPRPGRAGLRQPGRQQRRAHCARAAPGACAATGSRG